MFELAFLIGIYSYLIFALGLLHLLIKPVIFVITIGFWISSIVLGTKMVKKTFPQKIPSAWKSKPSKLILSLLFLQALINLVGVFGPELSFDALWYHLTLPKIYLMTHAIDHIPGGLFYYSDMPKLAEMLYTAALSIQGQALVKFIHFSFGVLSLGIIYKISRKFVSEKLALVACLIFYSNLVVGWESTTAYIDLVRTFFEAMALLGFLNWYESKEKKWLFESSLMLGFALSTKLIAVGSILIFISLFYISIKQDKRLGTFLSGIPVYLASLLVALPWFVFSFLNTLNPFYPLFTPTYKTDLSFSLLNPIRFISDVWSLFIQAADPISPVYALFIPLVFYTFIYFKPKEKVIAFYCLLSIFIWYITPRTGGGRFILPYLPLFSCLVVITYSKLSNSKLKLFLFSIILFIGITSIVHRGIASKKYIPVILGKQTQQEFLAKNLNFEFGDFYDIDGFIKESLNQNDRILVYGGHNLFYLDVPFIHESYAKAGDQFNYILTQNADIPDRFSFWNLVYYNSTTHVKLYTLGGKKWMY